MTEEIQVGDYFLDDYDNIVIRVVGEGNNNLLPVLPVGSKVGWAHRRDILLSLKRLSEQEALLHLLKYPQ